MKNSSSNKNNEEKELTGKAGTLRRIIHSAREEFADKGLENAHIQAIAENAGVTKQLIYHYFLNKDNLFACVIDETSDEAMAELVALNLEHLPPKEALRSMIYHMFDQFRDNPVLGALATDGIRYHETHETPRNRLTDRGPLLNQRMTEIIERGIEQGIFSKKLKPNFIFATIGLMVSGAYTSRYLINTLGGIDPTSPEDANNWKTFAAELILTALTNPSPDHPAALV